MPENKEARTKVASESEDICTKMKKQAIEDLKNGKFRIYEYGIASSPDTNTTILKKLGIELISAGCNVKEGNECYKEIMDSAITKKYKNEILRQSESDGGRIYFRNEFYIQSDTLLVKENIRKITKTLTNIDKLKRDDMFIQVFINKEGKPIKILFSDGQHKENNLLISEKLMKTNFEPLSFGNEKVNSILTTPIKIK